MGTSGKLDGITIVKFDGKGIVNGNVNEPLCTWAWASYKHVLVLYITSYNTGAVAGPVCELSFPEVPITPMRTIKTDIIFFIFY